MVGSVQRGETVILIASQALPNTELHASSFDHQMRCPGTWQAFATDKRGISPPFQAITPCQRTETERSIQA
jgi:hypothetical protein